MIRKNAKLKQVTGISFDAKSHKYSYNEGTDKACELESVTSWIGTYFCTPFNENNKHIFISNAVSNKNKSSGNGITNPEELRKYWNLNGERTSSNGTAAHCFIQMYHILRGYGEDLEPETGYELAAKQAYQEIIKDWEVIEIEKQVYNLDYLLAGHIDIVLKHRVNSSRYAILDWKTIRDMDKSYNKLKNELGSYDETPKNKATIQLSVYDYLGKYKSNYKDRYIVQLCSDGSYTIYGGESNPLNNFDNQVHKAIQSRKSSNIMDKI